MIALRGGRLVLPDRVVEGGSLLLDGPRIADVASGGVGADQTHDYFNRLIVPGFIDLHVHGVEAMDTLDQGWPIAAIAERLPRYGVTAFCPTSVACTPNALIGMLAAVQRARERPPCGARVLPAHLESNFISEAYRGAQSLACLRLPPRPRAARVSTNPFSWSEAQLSGGTEYDADDILFAISQAAGCTGILTLAPELPGALDLIGTLSAGGIRVSLGHSGASYEEALSGIDAGARHATHLFNRMPPIHHRDPGLVGAVLEREEVDAELICDAYHVHPSAARLALRSKTADRVIAITDGTAGSGMPVGFRARLGGNAITVHEPAVFLDDGTLAGSTATMDRVFRIVVERLGCSVVEAARMCSTNPARAMKLHDQGSLRSGALADFVVLDTELHLVETWVGGTRVWGRV